MTWLTYHVIFRLHSPMHIGKGKVGNLQRTHFFVTGRVFWGALAMRMTRNNPELLKQERNKAYKTIGDKLHEEIAYTYFYPTVQTEDETYKVQWPWENPEQFKSRLIRSYASTALSYPAQGAEEASLHETEFISPWTIDSVNTMPVFLSGYLFVKAGTHLEWRTALERLQFGGERCYGWGDVRLKECVFIENANLFDGRFQVDINQDRPVISLFRDARLLAHTEAMETIAHGDIEPLVGREWRDFEQINRFAGQHVAFNSICFTPGSSLNQAADFRIGKYGVWEK